jgi:hypothetical protein
MTRDDLVRLIEQYRAGLEAELTLLHQLETVASRQREASHAPDYRALEHAADERDRLMRGLVMVEEGVRDVRKTLSEFRQTASRLPGYETVAALHREASQLVARILSTDRQSLTALADAELARRSAVAGLERGETTLAAYRRVLAPPVASAAIVDRRG